VKKQKAILLSYFSGAAFTNDIISKYTPANDGNCTLCGKKDSRAHRILTTSCKKLADTRHPREDVVKWLRTQSEAWKSLAIMPFNDGILPLLCIHQLPFPDNKVPSLVSSVMCFVMGQPFGRTNPCVL